MKCDLNLTLKKINLKVIASISSLEIRFDKTKTKSSSVSTLSVFSFIDGQNNNNHTIQCMIIVGAWNVRANIVPSVFFIIDLIETLFDDPIGSVVCTCDPFFLLYNCGEG